MADFFKPEDFKSTHELRYGYEGIMLWPHNSSKIEVETLIDNLITTDEAAKIANQKIATSFESQNYKPQENEIFLYAVVDNFGRIYYTGHNEALAKSYIEDNCLKDRYVVELKGVLNV